MTDTTTWIAEKDGKDGVRPYVLHFNPFLALRVQIVRPDPARSDPARSEVGNRIKFTRLHLGSLALRPIPLPFRNSRPLITQTPLLRAIKAYGQFL